MVTRISPAKPDFNRKLVWESNDFSGGRNTENSNVQTQENQGTIYLNADFNYTTFFHKRGGFQRVKLSENETFRNRTGFDVSVVWVYNGLEEYNEVVGDYKIRPHQFIVIEERSTSDANADITRELMYFNPTTKEYSPVEYLPAFLAKETVKGGTRFSIDANTLTDQTKKYILYGNPQSSGSIGRNWNAISQSQRFPYDLKVFKITNDSNDRKISARWEYNKEKKLYENNEIKVLKNKGKLYIKIGGSDILGDRAFFLEQITIGDVSTFKQAHPYYTSVKEEEVIGWNLALTFWKYLETRTQREFKDFLKWGKAGSTINTVSNLMNTNFVFLPKLNNIGNKSAGGLRTNSPLMMPGNKVFNYSQDIEGKVSAQPFIYWKDTDRTGVDNPELQNQLQMSSTSATGEERKNPNEMISEGKPQGSQDQVSHYDYLKNLSKYSNSARLWNTHLTNILEAESSPLWSSEQIQRALYFSYTGAGDMTKEQLTSPHPAILKALIDNGGIIDLFLNHQSTNKVLSFTTMQQETYEIGFSQDKALWDAQYVALHTDQRARIDAADLEKLMSTNNIFKFNNMFGYINNDRVFFSLPQKPTYIPHNFDYTPPLEQENDKLQGVTFFYDQAILFSKYKIFKFVGQSPSIESKERMVLKELNNTIGAFARDSIQRATNKLIFLSKGGVRLLTRTYEGQDTINTKIIDEQVSDLLSELTEKDLWAKSTYFNGHYYLYVPSKNQFFISNIKGESTNEKNAWMMWDTPLLDLEQGKYFQGFFPNYNTNEFLMLMGGEVYIKTKDQWYDGNPGVGGDDQKLYDCIFQSIEIELDRSFHEKKIKNLKLLAYVPEKKGATLYVDAWADGFQILSSKKEKTTLKSGVEEVELVEEPNLSYDAGSWQNIEGAIGQSKLGYDKTPMQSIRVAAKKAGNVKIRIRNKSNKEFTLKAIGVEFKYKKAI